MGTSSSNTTPISVRIPEEISNRLTALAEATKRTRAYYIREAIIEHIQDLEDLYEAERISRDIRSGKSKTTPLSEVIAEYAMDN